MIGAVIYIRVSTKEQTDNLSLPTQLRACEAYCRQHGYEVLARFTEEGESAKTADRTELQRLLKFCRAHRGRAHFVVVYNLTRFAREKYDHFALRAHLKSLGISLRSATEPIDDSSTGKLMEGVLAAFAQFDNDVRSERTRAGMRAALELGRWTFRAPLGYRNARKPAPTLVPDPERAPLITRAFEDFATGEYTKQEVLEAVTRLGLRSRRGQALNKQSFALLLRNPLYIGRIESPEIGIAQRGDYAPLVSEATFYRVQALLDGRTIGAGPRLRNHPDFPLRGFVRCARCERPLTASWSKGRSGLYAYYHCQRRCRAINVRKAAMEGAFVELLATLQPTPGFMRLVTDQILTVWRELREDARRGAAESARAVGLIQSKLDRLDDAFLFEKVIDAATYERKRAALHAELTLAKIDQHATALDDLDVEGILAFAEQVLPSAAQLWVQASLEQKQRLQQVFFPAGVTFDGARFNRTGATASFLNELGEADGLAGEDGRPKYREFEPMRAWLLAIDAYRRAA